MPIFYGKGYFDTAKEFEGMYVSSCGNYWSNIPFTEERERQLRQMDAKKKWKETISKLRKCKKK